MSVHFDNGVIGSVVTSWATEEPGPGPRFAVDGTNGSIISENDGPLVVHSRHVAGVQPHEGTHRIDVTRHEYRDGFGGVCRAFVEWLRTGQDSPIDAREGLKDMEIVEASYQSAATGEAVQLPL